MSPETIKALPHSMIYLAVRDAGGLIMTVSSLISCVFSCYNPRRDKTQCSMEMLPKQGGIFDG